jgi:hypothetical protein
LKTKFQKQFQNFKTIKNKVMKTRNNTQETVKSQVRKMVLRGVAVIFSLVLISLTVKAQDFWDQFLSNSTSGKTAIMRVEQTSDNEKANTTFIANSAELSTQANNSGETFLCETEVEKELEVESWMIDGTYFSEAAAITEETEEALTVEDWIISNINFNTQVTSIEVDAEPAIEIEGWMTNEDFFLSAETLTAKDAELEIQKYADKQIRMQENRSEGETSVNNENFNKTAETLTAQEAEFEIEKYADKQIRMQEKKNAEQNLKTNISNLTSILTVDAEPVLEIEDWMINENFFKSAETLTARGADLEINKYAQKQIAQQQNRSGN